jgi:large subunit ribosomal protein L21
VYAVIESGGRQYKVTPGEVIEVNRLPVEPGQTIDLEQVLLIGGGDAEPLVGRPTVPGARVRAKVSGNPRSRKIIVFKYKSKVRYRRFNTHRQDLTRLVIKEILTGAEPNGSTATAAAPPDEEPTAGEPEELQAVPTAVVETTPVADEPVAVEETESGA